MQLTYLPFNPFISNNTMIINRNPETLCSDSPRVLEVTPHAHQAKII